MATLKSPRHERFAQELAQGRSGSEAYRNVYGGRGDVSKAAASRLLANVNVCERVKELQSRVVEGVVLTRQWVIERLIENANRAMQAEEVRASDGVGTGEYRYDGSVANRALELLGKELGMFVDRAENVNVHYAVSDVPQTESEWQSEHVTEH